MTLDQPHSLSEPSLPERTERHRGRAEPVFRGGDAAPEAGGAPSAAPRPPEGGEGRADSEQDAGAAASREDKQQQQQRAGGDAGARRRRADQGTAGQHQEVPGGWSGFVWMGGEGLCSFFV